MIRRAPLALVATAALTVCAGLSAEQGRAAIAFAGFEQLFREYREGDWQTAAAAFGKWPAERVLKEASVPRTADDATVAALAMFHTDTAMANNTFGEMAKGVPRNSVGLGYWGLDKAFEPHSRRAYELVEELIERAEERDDAATLAVGRSWYITAMCICHRAGRGVCTQSLSEKGESRFDDHADFRLVLGSVMHRTRVTQARLENVSWTSRQSGSQLPRWHFKRAMKMDPTLIEARLRFGHIIHVYLNDPDGRSILEETLRQAQEQRDSYFTYLAAFILGELHEDADRLEEAARYYAMAVKTTPAHTASVALGQALVRLGHREEGFEIGRRMFGLEGPGVEPIADPYVTYQWAQYREVPERMTALRRFARGR